MDQTKPANQNSRTKTLLAIGLAVVLVVVLATQYWPAGESPEETPLSVVRPAAPPTVVSTPADPVPVPKPAQERDLEQHPLPEVSVASVLMSNPFVPLGADPASPPVA
ncbi:MAG: hypothetical protein KDA37_16175, partial [Planctomycetales bacterium]|nr:hypothetical protein [Planctomycetales bacterium]